MDLPEVLLLDFGETKPLIPSNRTEEGVGGGSNERRGEQKRPEDVPENEEAKDGEDGDGRSATVKRTTEVVSTFVRASRAKHGDSQDVERDLTADRVGEAVVGELLLELLDEFGADLVDLFRGTNGR